MVSSKQYQWTFSDPYLLINSAFCAKTYCAKCRTKRRVFPRSQTREDGDICKVCDRKFFIREMLQENREQILEHNKELLGETGLGS